MSNAHTRTQIPARCLECPVLLACIDNELLRNHNAELNTNYALDYVQEAKKYAEKNPYSRRALRLLIKGRELAGAALNYYDGEKVAHRTRAEVAGMMTEENCEGAADTRPGLWRRLFPNHVGNVACQNVRFAELLTDGNSATGREMITVLHEGNWQPNFSDIETTES